MCWKLIEIDVSFSSHFKTAFLKILKAHIKSFSMKDIRENRTQGTVLMNLFEHFLQGI